MATVSGGYKPYRFNWPGPVTANTDTLRNPLPGLYSLTVTDSLGCQWRKQVNYSASVYPQTNPAGKVITVYPNPAKGVLYLKSSGQVNDALAEIYDLAGRMIYVLHISINPVASIRLPSNAAGTYLLKITAKDYNPVKK